MDAAAHCLRLGRAGDRIRDPDRSPGIGDAVRRGMPQNFQTVSAIVYFLYEVLYSHCTLTFEMRMCACEDCAPE